METPMKNGVPLSTLCPKYLHTNSTSHTWPFGAIAELIDNAFDPDVQAKHFWIDKTVIKEQDCLSFMDDGNGLAHDTMHKMLSFGYSDKTAKNGRVPIGRYGNGFKSGSMRLGKDVIVFSKSKNISCIGMLSQTYLEEIKAKQIVVPIVAFTHTDKSKISVQEEHKASLQAILDYSPFKTHEELLTELETISPPWSKIKTGTRIIIWNLRRSSAGSIEFDFETDRYDIRIPTDVDDEQGNTSTHLDRAASYKPLCEYSLRAYCTILYLRPRMKIIIRGSTVKTELITKSLAKTEKAEYRPTFLNKKIPIIFGYNPKSKDQYGIMMYHKKRLFKAYMRVGCQLKANSLGVGVIGVIECDFLEPTHNKQGFNDDEKYRKIIHNVGIKLEEYCKEIRYRWERQHPNSCALLEDAVKQSDQNWVQCDECSKWRKLPDGIISSKLPEKWFCHLNPDPQFRSCHTAEEYEDSDDEQGSFCKTYKQREREDKRQQEKKKKEEEDRKRQEVQLANRQQNEARHQPLQKTHSSPHTPATPRSRLNTESQKVRAARAEFSPLTPFTVSQDASTPSSNSDLPVISNVRSLSAGTLRGRKQPPTPQRTPKRPLANGGGRRTTDTASAVESENDGDEDIVILESASTPKPKKLCFDLNMVKTEPEPDDANDSMLLEGSCDAATDVASELNAAGQSAAGPAAVGTSPSPVPRAELTSATTQTEEREVKKEEEAEDESEKNSTAGGAAGPPFAGACNERCCPPDHLSIIELQEQQDNLLDVMEVTAQERDALKKQVCKLTCQLQDMQSRLLELSRINVKKERFHQACQTDEFEETEEGVDYKSLFEKAKQKVDELIKDKEAALAAAGTETSTGQGEENVSDDIALQVDFLLRELDQSSKEKNELSSQLESLNEEKAQLAAHCEELKLSLQQQRQAPQAATDCAVQTDTAETGGTAASGTDSSADILRSLIALRHNVGRLLVTRQPYLDLGQVNYECNVIDELLEQDLINLEQGGDV